TNMASMYRIELYCRQSNAIHKRLEAGAVNCERCVAKECPTILKCDEYISNAFDPVSPDATQRGKGAAEELRAIIAVFELHRSEDRISSGWNSFRHNIQPIIIQKSTVGDVCSRKISRDV